MYYEHDFGERSMSRSSTGTEDRMLEMGSKSAQFRAAEKGGEGRRKNLHGSETILKAFMKPFGITEIEMLAPGSFSFWGK
jgi:hypothetical protein